MRSGVIAQAHSVEWVQRGRRAAETAGPCEWWQLSWNLFCDEQEASAIQTKQAWYDQSETFGPQRVQGYSARVFSFSLSNSMPKKKLRNLGSTIRFPAESGAELHAVAYLGFQKGGIFSLGTSAHTKGGKPSFPIFFRCRIKFLPRGHDPMLPPKYATGSMRTLKFWEHFGKK